MFKMRVIKTIYEMRNFISGQEVMNRTIGFVPTMGALHRGHRELIVRSSKENDCTAVSIFVNPLQFGPNEDLKKYPRPIENDIEICQEAGASVIFNPSVTELLGNNMLSYVDINKMQYNLCGSKRPGHFRGVCSIVTKLFNIV